MLNEWFEAVEPRRLLAASGGYSIVDLSASAGDVGVTSAVALGISPNGRQIVGEGSSGGSQVGLVWVAGRHGARRAVVLPSDGGDASAVAVNDAGQIVGSYHVTPGDPNSAEHAVMWHFNRSRQRYVMEDLGVDVGGQAGTASRATAINASGVIVGEVSGLPNPLDNNSATRQDAVAWEPGGSVASGGWTAVNLSSDMHMPGTTGAGMPLDGPFTASAVSDSGAIAGYQTTLGGFRADAWVWHVSVANPAAHGYLYYQATHDLLYTGQASAITSDGSASLNEAIGDSITANAILLQHVSRSQYHTPTFQPLAGGARSWVNAMNDHGESVGTVSVIATPSSLPAVLWRTVRHGKQLPATLFSLIPAWSGWTSLDDATGIDQAGDVVGAGTVGGSSHAFLMIKG